ncbi:OLC1v1015200C1 [Oldenlandia corymbosa var. corymbosa]|uniref:OLC1v1015200C1 n=1 Tax=Oldenlandia corymbosa var. corymbosa TaxID=529605 RepID=A0AAV1E2M5_OLDCO|nr:OLC1v1015200C1 [Oldenlandia corymbosa var. corymbosa]
MRSDMPLDYALFQLSPKRSRCELVVSSGRYTEKLASGLVKPFAAHLRVIEEQVEASVHSIKLEVERRNDAETWFSKGTLERFVRFVSTPEILEIPNTFDAEVAQLESARRIYSQGTGDQLSGTGGAGSSATAAADATKKELLRAIDVRLVAAQQDLATACGRAAAAGFNPDTVMDLQMFADRFGAQRLYEACSKIISLYERRPDLIGSWQKAGGGDDWAAVRSSHGSDMSIDEEPTTPPESQPTGFHQPHLRHEQQKQRGQDQESKTPLTSHEPKPSFTSGVKSRESSVESEEVTKQDNLGPETGKNQEVVETPDQAQSIQASQPSRRLSVQDRVKLFENKQKETSGNSGGSGGGKLVVGKSMEFRRLSSDVSAMASAAAVEKAERAVLRRWSGVSDMSLDLSFEKKDLESPLCTPSSSSKPEDQKDTASSSKLPEMRILPGKVDNSAASFDKSEEVSEGSKLNSSSATVDSSALKDQPWGRSQPKSFLNSAEDNSLANSGKYLRSFSSFNTGGASGAESQHKFKGFEKRDEAVKMKGSAASEVQAKGVSQLHVGYFSGKGDTSSAREPTPIEFKEVGVKDNFVSESHLKVPQGSSMLEGGLGSRTDENFSGQYKGNEGENSSSKSRVEFSALETKDVEKKDLASNLFGGSSAVKSVDSGPQKTKGDKQITTASEHVKKNKVRGDDNTPVYGTYKNSLSSKIATDIPEDFGSFTTPPPPDHSQRNRQAKGNQELNDELKMKANELEKLFAEHKLRVPGDQSNPARRSRPVDKKIEQPVNSFYKPSIDAAAVGHLDDDISPSTVAGSSKNISKLNDAPLAKTSSNSSELNASSGSRGKFYQSYMQKRDAKLKEEWSLKRGEKEAKLKEMQDNLERSRAEMKARFSGATADSQDSQFNARRRAERLRSFNTRSIMRREQQQLDFGQSDNDEDNGSEFPDQKYYVEDNGPLDEATSFIDGLSRSSAQSKKIVQAKNSLTSSTPRSSAAPVKAASRATVNSSRRKLQSENPLAQSVPNFSELRKENAKPSATSKMTRSQVRNYNRSKSTNEDTQFIKEEKSSRRPQSLKKISANPVDSIREISPLDSEVVSLNSKTLNSKPSRKKGSIDFGVIDDLVFETENCVVEDEEEDQYEALETKSSGENVVNQKSEKGCFGTKTTVARTFDDMDSSLVVAELPASVPSDLHPTESAHDSPGESPISWNSRSLHPFSYPHDLSDIDASVDSPIGSPASWNSHSLSQTETDAARMRKKWGAAQKPMLVGGNSSHNQSRKDVTRGFKRLLKFGRKSRGTESLVDWISATTSEGDDDTEDGRDVANRSSEDLRKSRMGFSNGHPSDDSFNESEFFNDQVQSLRSSIPAPPANFKLREDHLSGSSIKAPRSFFSLSTFRSKGSESKPR